MPKAVRVRYEKGASKPLEKKSSEKEKGFLIRVERAEDRRKIVEKLYGKHNPAPKELLDKFMLEDEASPTRFSGRSL